MRPRYRYTAGVVLLSAAAFGAGCDTTTAKPSAGVGAVEATKPELEKVRKETKEAAQATKDYGYAVRAQFVKDMQEELAAVNKALEQLSAKVEASNAAAKADAKAKVEALRGNASRLTGELDKLKNAQEVAWEQAKAGFKKSHEELKASVAQARTWLSEKIAP
ncbi:MAG: hypothetical protein IT371_14055 [Deltaproteobacteria bacterium]|nr:hypothetical protein [Deltaproteobacteria bacterium]